MPPIRSSRHRKFVFTLNNPDIDGGCGEGRCALPDGVQGRSFLYYQVEKGESGTVHVQGLVCFNDAISLLSAKRRIGGNPHVEVMKGSVEQAIHYSSKPHDGCDCAHCVKARLLPNGGVVIGPWSEGERPVGQGKRTDIVSIFEAVRAGDTTVQIAEAHPGAWCRNRSSILEYRSLIAAPRSEQTVSLVLWGPPGSGKTFRALHTPGTKFWLTRPNSRGGAVWWDGYANQEIVVIDEFYGWLPRSDAQRLCDASPFRVQVKGGSVSFGTLSIIWISNVHPSDWWRNLGLGAMARRLAAPCGSIEYVGDKTYPTADSWRNSEEYASSHLPARTGNFGGDGPVSTNLRV